MINNSPVSTIKPYQDNLQSLDKKESSRIDEDFINENFSQSPYYSTKDYLCAFNYFKSAKTQNNLGILNKEAFDKKIEKHYPDLVNKEYSEKILYNNLTRLLELSPSSIEASYIQTLIELIQEGKLNESAFRTIPVNWKLSDEIIEDIELLYKAIIDNKDRKKLDKELRKLYTPTFKDEKTAIENSRIGDSFIIEGEEYIRIKTSNNEAQRMNITPDTYYTLFPPIERFATSQQLLGDCYLIETLAVLYQNPSQRAHIIKLFSQDKDGNIIINFPNAIDSIKFQKTNLAQQEDEDIYCAGAKGFRLLEYAYGKMILDAQIEQTKRNLKNNPQELEEFKEFLQKNKDNIYFNDNLPNLNSYSKFSEELPNIKQGLFKNGKTYIQYLIGNGGQPSDVYQNLGYFGASITGFKNTKELEEELDKIGIGYENLSTCTIDKHVYGIKVIIDENNKKSYYLINPHSQMFYSDITKEIDSYMKKGIINCFNVIELK